MLADPVADDDAPLVDSEKLQLDFSFDAGVDRDFYGRERAENSNSAGPFASVRAGQNSFDIYTFTERYMEALRLTGQQ